jgi:predicted ABC-type sugar transport system permease subunit
MMAMEGHSIELFALLGGCTLLVGLFGYLHARRFWEGLPPLLDGFVSAAGFAAIMAGFVFGGRVGSIYGHPHAGRVIAVTAIIIVYRSLRTWIGKEQVKYRKVRVKPTEESGD